MSIPRPKSVSTIPRDEAVKRTHDGLSRCLLFAASAALDSSVSRRALMSGDLDAELGEFLTPEQIDELKRGGGM